jgi:hypothetical protein
VGLQEVADGYQLTTRADLSGYVERFLVGRRRARLSRAALETLATIAYRQPVTRGEIEDLRGVDCGQVLHTLLTRELVTVRGRSEGLGRPLLYGTTPEFLTYFGLRGLSDLPNLEEFQSLTEGDPLEDPEIRGALEANGLLDGLDDDPSAPPVAELGEDAVSSGTRDELPAGRRERAHGSAPGNGHGDAEEEDFAREISSQGDQPGDGISAAEQDAEETAFHFAAAPAAFASPKGNGTA